MGFLCDFDIDDLKRLFPMGKMSPNWALTGGGAVKYLMEATKIGNQVFHQCDYIDRSHKDMDVVVFEPQRTKLILRYPHELYWKIFGHDLVRTEYDELNNRTDAYQFCIEFAHQYHFGFPPPYQNETTLCQTPYVRVWTVIPEYCIASRLFHHWPMRENIDFMDCMNLQNKFKLRMDAIRAIVERSSLSFLTADLIHEAVSNCDRSIIRNSAIQMLFNRYPFLKQLDIDPEYLMGYLALPEGYLNEKRFSSTYDIAEMITDKNNSASIIGMLNIIYALTPESQTKYIDSYRTGRDYRWLFEDVNSAHYRISFEFMLYMYFLAKQLQRMDMMKKFDMISNNLTIGFMESDYLHVYASAMQQAARRLETAQRIASALKPLNEILKINIAKDSLL